MLYGSTLSAFATPSTKHFPIASNPSGPCGCRPSGIAVSRISVPRASETRRNGSVHGWNTTFAYLESVFCSILCFTEEFIKSKAPVQIEGCAKLLFSPRGVKPNTMTLVDGSCDCKKEMSVQCIVWAIREAERGECRSKSKAARNYFSRPAGLSPTR